jgi:hypothetical protein
MWTKGQGVQAADSALNSYGTQLTELRGEATSVAADQKVVVRELAETLTAVARTLLPDANPATLESAGAALGLPLAARRHEMQSRRAAWAAELAAIERDAHFVQRQTLLHREHGGFVREQQRCDAVIREGEAQLSIFQANEDFQWLSARADRQQIETGALSSFWDAVTFGGYREERAKARCAAALGFADHATLEATAFATNAAMQHARDTKAHVDKQRARLLKLLDNHGNLYRWTHDFENRLRETLEQEVAQWLGRTDLSALHGRAPEPIRPLVAKGHALTKKLDYMANLLQFLEREATDREHRMRAIQQTRTTWAMKPWEQVRSDKSKWLVGLPAAKRASTQKQVRFSRRMHRNIVDYDDYDDYDYYLGHSSSFLAYDAFAYGCDEPMPYEGFSRGVCPEIAHHRSHHNQHRADNAHFRELDRQAAREEREHQRAEREAERSDGVHPLLPTRHDASDLDRDGIADGQDFDRDGDGIDDMDDPDGGDGTSDEGSLSEAEASIETDDSSSDGGDVS